MGRKQFQLLSFALLVEHLHAFQPPGLRGSVQFPPSSTASSGEDHSPFAPSLPTTSRCDPYRPCCVDALAKTSACEFVIRRGWLQEGRSALHRFFFNRDCKD